MTMGKHAGAVAVVALGMAGAGAVLSAGGGSSLPPPDRRGGAIEAEAMANVGRVRREPAASGGHAAALRPGDTLSATLHTSVPTAQLQARVRGARCRLAPELEIILDGRRVLHTQVSSPRWAVYSTSLPALAPAGRHALRVRQTIGSGQASCSKRLQVDRVALQRQARLPPVTLRPPRLSSPRKIRLDEAHAYVDLDPGTDYVIRMPDRPLEAVGPYGSGIRLVGGRNVVLVGGHVRVRDLGGRPSTEYGRGVSLDGQTGIVHIEGLRLDGMGLAEGIQVNHLGRASLQLANIRCGPLRAHDERTFVDTHPDCLQLIGGPRRLLVDGFTGLTDFQGLLIKGTDQGQRVRYVSLRRVQMIGLDRPVADLHRSFLFNNYDRAKIAIGQECWATTRGDRPGLAWPTGQRGAFANCRVGWRPGGEIVTATQVGAGYVQPGYAP
jgi:hypothetical protein